MDNQIKQQVLQALYQCFSEWAAPLSVACRAGCADCCTLDVTMTALEGENISTFIGNSGRQAWFLERLQQCRLPTRFPRHTTNEYARSCLQGVEVDSPPGGPFGGVCPFLEERLCTIYEVRPFSCRCFVSTTTCGTSMSAVLPDYYVSAATVVNQLIEHLDQGAPWGTMLCLLQRRVRAANREETDDKDVRERSLEPEDFGCLTARPLPGFLLDQRDYSSVAPLIERIFKTRVAGCTVEHILNGGLRDGGGPESVAT